MGIVDKRGKLVGYRVDNSVDGWGEGKERFGDWHRCASGGTAQLPDCPPDIPSGDGASFVREIRDFRGYPHYPHHYG